MRGVQVIAAGGLIRSGDVVAPLNAVRAEYGLLPDPQLQMLTRYLVLSPVPPSYRDPNFPAPPTAHAMRPRIAMPSDDIVPWLTALDDKPLVYFTLGTIFNRESGDLFSRVINGLREMPINLVVTVGKYIDPSELGAQPANVRIENYIPQGVLLPHCDLAVSHAGSGSVMGALAHGVPQVLLPMGADQPMNAARCRALGVAHVLDAVSSTSVMIRGAAEQVMSDPAYRQAAQKMRAEIASLPDFAHAVALLERLATEKRPDFAN